MKIAYLNSRYIELKNAKINIEDRGLQFGDSVYEVLAIVNKKLIDKKFHFLRLKYSLKELDINFKVDNNKLEKIFVNLIKKNLVINGIIYLQITRGVQSRDHKYKEKLKPNLIIYTQKKKFNLPNKELKGVSVITYEDLRWSRRDIKTTNLLPNILAENMANNKKAYTAILIKNKKVTEAAHANVWIIKKNIIYTHPSNTDILGGITKIALKLLIKKYHLKLIEKSFSKEQLFKADEAFLTSSGSFVTPILKVDKKVINKGKIGSITLNLSKLYLKSFSNE